MTFADCQDRYLNAGGNRRLSDGIADHAGAEILVELRAGGARQSDNRIGQGSPTASDEQE